MNNELYIIYGCIGEDEDFDSWVAAVYNDKKLAQKHMDLADKYLSKIDKEDLPDKTPFDEDFYCAHEKIDYHDIYHPKDLVSYFMSTVNMWNEKKLLNAIGQSWKE